MRLVCRHNCSITLPCTIKRLQEIFRGWYILAAPSPTHYPFGPGESLLALDDDDSGFLLGSLCGGTRTAQGFPTSEKHHHAHHNAASPIDGAHGWCPVA